jgi:hypothetical protein
MRFRRFKKTLATALPILLIMLLLSACVPELVERRTILEREDMKLPLIITTEFSEYPVGTELIHVTLQNPTDDVVPRGHHFFFENMVDGVWGIFPFSEDGAWRIGTFSVAEPNEEWTRDFDIVDLFDKPLPEGTYRISYVTYDVAQPVLEFRSNEFTIG